MYTDIAGFIVNFFVKFGTHSRKTVSSYIDRAPFVLRENATWISRLSSPSFGSLATCLEFKSSAVCSRSGTSWFVNLIRLYLDL